MQPEIIYIYDPLCGWCYGFSKVIKQLKEKYENNFSWSILSGGMAVDNNATPIKEISEYILEALPVVHKMTGAIFGESFKELLNTEYEHNSLLPSIAMSVFKDLKKDKVIEFSYDIQKAFFYDGKSLNDLNTYLEIIADYDINPVEFTDKFNDEAYKKKAYDEFSEVEKFRINGFPNLIIKENEKYTFIARGFQTEAKLDASLRRFIR